MGPFDRRMKRNDTGQPVRGSLTSKSTGLAVDLTNVSITFVMYLINDDGTTTEIVNASATVDTPASNGTWQYNWQVGDTEDVGTHLASFQLIFADEGDRKETYPQSGWINIEIEPDLEDA